MSSVASNCNRFDSNSVCDTFGSYDSRFSGDSIWNGFSEYGSRFSNYSPWNKFSEVTRRLSSMAMGTLGAGQGAAARVRASMPRSPRRSRLSM